MTSPVRISLEISNPDILDSTTATTEGGSDLASLELPGALNDRGVVSVLPPKDIMNERLRKAAMAKMTTTERWRAIVVVGDCDGVFDLPRRE
jgi:hypothetical protein